MHKIVLSIFNYLWYNKIATLFVGYILVSAFIKSFFGLDICIPCIWKSIFGFTCPGCGLTTALMSLMKFDWIGAYKANFLIFIILPAGLFYVVHDFNRFKKAKGILA